MKLSRIACLAALPAALVGLPVAPAFAGSAPEAEVVAEPSPQTEGELRLARLLEGRVAGEPVRCIRSLPSQRMQTIARTAYVYGAGNTIYVQRTLNPELINANDALVTNRFSGTQLCRFDVTTTIDRFNGFFTGAVILEDFVPYTRVRSEGAEG